MTEREFFLSEDPRLPDEPFSNFRASIFHVVQERRVTDFNQTSWYVRIIYWETRNGKVPEWKSLRMPFLQN